VSAIAAQAVEALTIAVRDLALAVREFQARIDVVPELPQPAAALDALSRAERAAALRSATGDAAQD